jgi:hypothetical protein
MHLYAGTPGRSSQKSLATTMMPWFKMRWITWRAVSGRPCSAAAPRACPCLARGRGSSGARRRERQGTADVDIVICPPLVDTDTRCILRFLSYVASYDAARATCAGPLQAATPRTLSNGEVAPGGKYAAPSLGNTQLSGAGMGEGMGGGGGGGGGATGPASELAAAAAALAAGPPNGAAYSLTPSEF